MSSGGGLADLVTQVPDEEDDHGTNRLTAAAPQGSSRFSKACACLFRHDRSVSQQKLASVVPGEPKLLEQPPALAAAVSTVSAGNSAAKTGQAEPAQHRRHTPPSAEHIWGPTKCDPPQLGPQVGDNVGRKTLALDLDETLVHSSFRATPAADIIITVELEGECHPVYVRKRPGVDEFLVRVAQVYEVVVYTASMAKYANPLLDELDKYNTVHFRLFREACTRSTGGYVKDLCRLGRDLRHVIIIDNSPICYALQPNNAIPIRTFKDDMTDRELLDLIPILYSLVDVEDIPEVLKQIVWGDDEDEDP